VIRIILCQKRGLILTISARKAPEILILTIKGRATADPTAYAVRSELVLHGTP